MSSGGIVVVDYGLGNLLSVRNMMRKGGYDADVTSDHDAIRSASHLLLPGVGAFDDGMRNLAERGLIDVLNETVLGQQTPILGICLGLQLMSRGSEEGALPGLGWLEADTVRLDPAASDDLRVPHMGWNTVIKVTDTFLSRAVADDARFYFVHSYHVRFDQPGDATLVTPYGREITAAAVHRNVAGTQFHPEKSHKFGLSVLCAFMQWNGHSG